MKKCIKRNYDILLLRNLMEKIEKGIMPDLRYRDHILAGKFAGCRECHIAPDWLLIYKITEKTLVFIRIGTHSDLFK